MSIGAFGENFPYVNFHDLNLDWIIKTLKELNDKFDDAIASKITVADPLQWDITKQYEAYTIVMDDNNVYLSMKPVPYGTPITDTEYWQEVFNLSDVFASLKDAVSFSDDGESTTSSANRAVNDLVWLNNVLYKVISSISLGDTYSSSNVEEVSVELWAKSLLETAVSSLTNDLNSAVNTLNTSITNGDNRVQNLFKRNRKSVILIGDSYGIDYDYWRGWISAFSTLYGANVTVKGKAVGGSAFNPGDLGVQPYNQTLLDVLATMTDEEKANVTDVIALGGYNDVSYGTTEEQLTTYFNQFRTTALTACPNAKVSVGCIAVHYANEAKMRQIKTMMRYFESASAKAGIANITNMNLVLLNKSLIFIASGNPSSNFHPNTDGNNAIAKHLYNYITTGNIGNVIYAELLFNANYNVYVENGVVQCYPTTPAYMATTGYSFTGWTNFLSLENSNLLWCFNDLTSVMPSCPCSIVDFASTPSAPAIVHARLLENYLQIGNIYYSSAIAGSAQKFLTLPTFTLAWQTVY